LGGVAALTSLRLKADRVWADEPFKAFIKFVNKVRNSNGKHFDIGGENSPGMTSSQAEQMAPLLSEIGDAYADIGDRKTALIAYQPAKEAWTALGKRGIYNLAVVEQRIGEISLADKHFDDASILFTKSANTSEELGGKNDIAKSKVLFDQADALWQKHDFVNSFFSHTEALRAWSQLHSTEKSKSKSSK
jgi:tetratricopeptide (TPR) repeat protein